MINGAGARVGLDGELRVTAGGFGLGWAVGVLGAVAAADGGKVGVVAGVVGVGARLDSLAVGAAEVAVNP